MGSVTLTGNDSTIVSGRIISDVGDGDIGVLAYPNNMVEVKTGKNGNAIFALNKQGDVATFTIRVLAGSADDKYFNSQIALYKQDPPSYTLLTGEFVKRAGDGAGNVASIVYQVAGGLVQKMPDAKENVEGDTEQAIAIYQLIFANAADRSIS